MRHNQNPNCLPMSSYHVISPNTDLLPSYVSEGKSSYYNDRCRGKKVKQFRTTSTSSNISSSEFAIMTSQFLILGVCIKRTMPILLIVFFY